MVARYLSKELQATVIGADVVELPTDFTLDWELDAFVHLPNTTSSTGTCINTQSTLQDLTLRLVRGTHFFLQKQYEQHHSRGRLNNPEDEMDEEDPAFIGQGYGLDAIICASGGWKGDPEPILEDSETDDQDKGGIFGSERRMEQDATQYVEAIDTMRRMNLDPVLAAGYIAQQYMNPNGLVVVIGATAALSPTPGMLGYGLAKAASHHFVQTLGACTGKSVVSKATRKAGRKVRRHLDALDTMTVVGILPTTIDTSANRKARPKENFDQWTKPYDIASEIGHWMKTPALRPHSGALVKVRPNLDGPGATFELAR